MSEKERTFGEVRRGLQVLASGVSVFEKMERGGQLEKL